MDMSYFEKILRTHQNNNTIKVLEIKKNIATAKGDNYLSNIYRIIVTYNKEENGNMKLKEEISLIVKSKVLDFDFGTAFVDNCFKKEIYIFENVLPKIEKLVGCSIAPFNYLCDEKNGNIVLEDLGLQGYAIENRLKGISIDHCLKAIEKLAKFHAGSVALHEKEPHLLKRFDSISIQEELFDDYFQCLENTLEKLSNGIEKIWKEKEYQEIVSKLRKLVSKIKPELLETYKHDADEFCVLNHGDFWINNMMFKNNEKNKPCDTLFVDFQVISYTSPAIDVQHFLGLCPDLELKGEKDDFFLESYLGILKNTMTKIGCKTTTPTIIQLKEAIYKRRMYAILTGLIYAPCTLANIIKEGEDEVKGSFFNADVFSVPTAVQTVHKMTKLYLEKGYLD